MRISKYLAVSIFCCGMTLLPVWGASADPYSVNAALKTNWQRQPATRAWEGLAIRQCE